MAGFKQNIECWGLQRYVYEVLDTAIERMSFVGVDSFAPRGRRSSTARAPRPRGTATIDARRKRGGESTPPPAADAAECDAAASPLRTAASRAAI